MSRDADLEICSSGVEAVAVGPTLNPEISVLPARMKGQREAVHAVSHSGRRRAVGKQVAQVPAASRAMNLSPGHAETVIARRPDRMLERRPETRPSGTAFELRVRRKQRLSTAGAAECPVAFFAIERTRASRLGAVRSQHLKLLRRQRLTPLIFRFCQCLFSHASSLPNQESGTKVLYYATSRTGRCPGVIGEERWLPAKARWGARAAAHTLRDQHELDQLARLW